MKVYSSFADAVNMEIVEPIAAGLDAGEDPRDLFDVAALARPGRRFIIDGLPEVEVER